MEYLAKGWELYGTLFISELFLETTKVKHIFYNQVVVKREEFYDPPVCEKHHIYPCAICNPRG